MKGIYKFNSSSNKLKNPEHSLEIFTMKDGQRLGLNKITDKGDVFIGVLQELPGDLYSFWHQKQRYRLEVFEDEARIF